jgi:signal transduction histidine kinase
MEALMSSVANLRLANVVEAWGIERVQDVVGSIQNGASFVAVQNGAGQARVLHATIVEKADPEMILDMIRGGREAIYVDASTETDALPEHRPLLVRKGDKLLGLLDDEAFRAPKDTIKPKRWSGTGGADAQEAALCAVRAARETFRHKGIALILDIQPSRVGGDPRLVQDLVDHLLEGALEIIERNGGGSGVHVTVGQGEAGLWIGVEDSGTKSLAYDVSELLDEEPTDDLALLGIRRMQERVKEAGGQMRIIPTRTGTRFMVCLPAPS